MKLLPAFLLLIAPLSPLSPLSPLALAAPPVPLEIKSQDGVAIARWNNQPVLEYVLAPSPFKPYARALFTPSGLNVARDQVPDHIHHHGLMFAVKVDDVNFWEEAKAPGKQAAGDWRPSGIGHGMMQPIEWLAPTQTNPDKTPPDKTVLLLETRRITFQESPDPAAHLLTWQSTFSVPPGKGGKESARITGSHYHGLGLRFAKSMDAQGPFIHAGDKEGEIVRGDEKLYTAPWCAYTATIAGTPGQPGGAGGAGAAPARAVTVAMFDGAKNPRPATFFTMARPFAYLSATMKYHKEPLVVEKDKPVTLTYGVAVWDGKPAPEQIEKVYQAWLAASR